jgi:hypothetical protein
MTVLEDTGHLSPLEVPGQVARQITAYPYYPHHNRQRAVTAESHGGQVRVLHRAV